METFPQPILSRDGTATGTLTGATRRCQMEGCRGEQLLAVWPDGTRTWPCTKGLKTTPDGTYQIG
jgi:hypothetical protein